MTGPDPEIQLSRLREIGWARWDPIGLKAIASNEDGTINEGCVDEYDWYLLHVASLIRSGHSEVECAEYLVKIEVDDMGVGIRADARHRAVGTTAAIKEYLATLRIQ